jgi:hypothetical protein
MDPELVPSAPMPKRKVLPGKAGRSPFVQGYKLPERASGTEMNLYVNFLGLEGMVMKK